MTNRETVLLSKLLMTLRGIAVLVALVTCFATIDALEHSRSAYATALSKAAVQNKAPEPVTAKAERATVRIDTNGSFAGVGIVVSKNGHVLTSLPTVLGWRYTQYTAGDGRAPLTVVGVDEAHELALLCAGTSLGEPASVAATRSPNQTPVIVSGYVRIASEPPMIAKRKDGGVVTNASYVGESSNALDLRDLVVVRVRRQDGPVTYVGSPVISAKTGDIDGYVIGHLLQRYDTSDLLVMPASIVRSFLQSKGVPLP